MRKNAENLLSFMVFTDAFGFQLQPEIRQLKIGTKKSQHRAEETKKDQNK